MKRNYLATLMVSEVSLHFGINQKITNNAKRKFLYVLLGFIILPIILYKAFYKFKIPYIEIAVTAKCNLKCEGCSNLMPYYKSPGHVDITLVKRTINTLLQASREITIMKFIGGEPFLYDNLYLAVEQASGSEAVRNIEITTNGTILPKERNLECLKNDKIKLIISEYPAVSSKRLIELLEENQVKYETRQFENWEDYGDLCKRGYSEKDLRRSFRFCASAECKTVYMDSLYTCPRSAHGRALGLIPVQGAEENGREDSVNLISTPKKDLRRKIRGLYAVPYVQACDYCNAAWERKMIESGKQKCIIFL